MADPNEGGNKAFRAALESIRRSFTVKAMAIAFLILLLLAPKAAVMELIRDREANREVARTEVSGMWGGAQTVAGPFLCVPYESFARDEKGAVRTVLHHANNLPETVTHETSVATEIRTRGIFDVILYTATLGVRGEFRRPLAAEFSADASRIHWNRASFVFGITDLRGIETGAKLEFAGSARTLDPGAPTKEHAASAIHSDVDLSTAKDGLPFRLDLALRGAGTLSFVPAARLVTVDMRSPWGSPSFRGAFLPSEREVKDSGFHAAWRVPHLARSIPQHWSDNEVDDHDFAAAAFGVSLYQPVDAYQIATRSAKYGILFLALTFLIFFLFEVLVRLRVHPIQYLLVGFALLLFYVLLLALTEHMPFGLAYLVASGATVALIGVYSGSVLVHRTRAGGIAFLLAFLYAYLYCLLKAEDHALLLGSVGLFLALASVMYATRKVDWYGVKDERGV